MAPFFDKSRLPLGVPYELGLLCLWSLNTVVLALTCSPTYSSP